MAMIFFSMYNHVSGPPIGVAKSGINFDPNDPRKKEVLKRWYAAVTPLLKHYYGTCIAIQ